MNFPEENKEKTEHLTKNLTFFACDIFNISNIFCHLTTLLNSSDSNLCIKVILQKFQFFLDFHRLEIGEFQNKSLLLLSFICCCSCCCSLMFHIISLFSFIISIISNILLINNVLFNSSNVFK